MEFALRCCYCKEKNQYNFFWNENERKTLYCLEGLVKNNCETLCTTAECRCFLPVTVAEKYSSFRIKCFYQDVVPHELVLAGISGFVTLPKSDTITIKAVRSYEGITLSFQSDEIFEEYNLFEAKGTEKKLLLSGQVCCVHSPLLKEGADYYVEGVRYQKIGEEDVPVCVARSAVIRCSPVLPERSPSEKVRLSVIVPVYNIAWQLPRTLDAVVSSTVQDLELILVDDGSTDGSAAICDWYAANYAFVKVIHTANKDVCHARNVGMGVARGEFLIFLDHDDVVHPLMYERLLKAAEEQHSDIAIAQVFVLNYNGTIRDRRAIPFEKVFESGEGRIVCKTYREMLGKEGEGFLHGAVWHKIIRSTVARKVRFNENFVGAEDLTYTCAVYSYIDKFVFVRDAYYVWDCSNQKMTGTRSNINDSQKPLKQCLDRMMSCFYVLLCGNPDPEVSEIYKLEVLRMALRRYPSPLAEVNRLMAAMLKYYVAKYQLPVAELRVTADGQDNRKLYDNYLAMKKIAVQPFDGYGKIPEDILLE